MNNSIFNVLIIGAGAIGAFYDTPASKHILTHAHAFSSHPGFNLLGFVDLDLERLQHAARLWGCRTFKSIDEACTKERVDIVCIAVPDSLHYNLLKEISQFPLRAIFTEKPLTTKLWQAEEIIELYTATPIPICVNYKRSFVPEFEAMRNKISTNTFGRYLTGTGYYGKGFLHNGSHLIHLLNVLNAKVIAHKIVSHENDHYSDDPSISATIEFDNGTNFGLYHIGCHNFTIFEIDFLFEKGRVKIIDTGFKIEYYVRTKHDIFKDYTVLTRCETVDTSLDMALYFSVDNIYRHLTSKQPLKCSLYEAFETMKLCSKLQANVLLK